jgi:hypothetical protein
MAVKCTLANASEPGLFILLNWELIRDTVAENVERRPQPDDLQDIDGYLHHLLELVTPAINKSVPLAKPSPYAKK